MKKIIIYILLILVLSGCGYEETFTIGNNNITDETVSDNIDDNKEENKSSNNPVEVNLGQNIEFSDNYIISFISSNFSQKIVPTNPDSFYTYYEVQDKSINTYFMLKTTIKNLGGETLSGEKLPSATLIYDNKYKYNLSLITETDDSSDLEGYDWYMDIDPLKTKKIWYYVEIPIEIENSNEKSLVVEYQFNNKIYDIIIR